MIQRPIPTLALLASLLLAAGAAHAQTTPAPVGIAEEAVISGKVVDVDVNSKAVLVQGPKGNIVEIVGGDEAKNIGNVRKGDIVTLTRAAAVVAALEPLDSKDTALMEQVERTSRAPEGGKPGVMREITTTITAQITKIDTANRTVTFRGPRETLRTVKVRDPNIDLTKIKQGQMAKIVVREIVAITVKSPNAG
jgi:antitoxin (DNA-binding transcriptional repressor) of toxin-antitoxin stability system